MNHQRTFGYLLFSVVMLINGLVFGNFPISVLTNHGVEQNHLSDDFKLSEFDFRYAPGIDDFSTAEFVNTNNPALNKCTLIKNDLQISFPDEIKNISEVSGVNPRILLTLIDINFDVFSSNTSSVNCEEIIIFLDAVRTASHHMMEAWSYYQLADYDPAETVATYSEARNEINDGVVFAINEGLKDIPNVLQKDALDFSFRYFEYFGNASKIIIENVEKSMINAPVIYKLPFTGKHTFSGGPHGGGSINSCDGIDSTLASGLDFAGSFLENGSLNDAVVAIAPGTIVGIKNSIDAPGKWVAIRHDNGIVSMYWHMSIVSNVLQLNDYVGYGAYLGDRGNTGCSGCGIHIHLELRTGGTNYNEFSGIGVPVTWDGRVIDGHLIESIIKADDKAANYQGTAIIMKNVYSTSIKQFSMCGGIVNAIVENNFPNTGPINSQNTLFADKNPTSILVSSNDALFYCPLSSNSPAGNPLLENVELPLGICDLPDDYTPPSGSFASPSNGSTITSRTVTIGANASDNSGGSGIREVRFKAHWPGVDWSEIGVISSTPYSIQWDMCNANIPQGGVDLDLDIYDNAGNKYTYSSNHSPLHITKNFDCSGSGLPSVNQWHAEAWMNKSLAGYVNHDEYWPAGVTSGVPYPFIGFEKDWGDGAPYSGFPADEFSFKIYSNLYFRGGIYHFRVCSDDGVVFEIDGQRVFDEWWDRGGCLQTERALDNKYHTLEVRYYENRGSAYIKLYIWGEEYPQPELDSPDGRITSPANNSFINQNPLTIWADAWDDKSGVDHVKFKVYHCVGGCQWRDIGTSASSPYHLENWDWSALDGQQVKLAIDVYDKSGKSRSNANGELRVNLDRTAPVVSILLPLNGNIDEDKQVYINVSSTDSGSGMASVKFYAGYVDGSGNYWHEIGTDTNGGDGWGLNWNATGLRDGTQADIFVTSYDRAGNSNSAAVYDITIGELTSNSTYLPTVMNFQPVSVSISMPISGNDFDCFQDVSKFNLSGDVYKNNWIGTSQAVMTGLVFSTVGIPQGAKITNAYLRLRGYGMDGMATARIFGFAQDNSSTFFADGSNKPSLRPSTSTYVDWYNEWPFAWTYFESPDLSAIIQEIVSRPGWKFGNNIGFKITNPFGTGVNWSIADYTAGSAHSVTLFVTYEE